MIQPDCTSMTFVPAQKVLTLSPPLTTTMPYANSLDLDETPSNTASHPDPSCLTL